MDAMAFLSVPAGRALFGPAAAAASGGGRVCERRPGAPPSGTAAASALTMKARGGKKKKAQRPAAAAPSAPPPSSPPPPPDGEPTLDVTATTMAATPTTAKTPEDSSVETVDAGEADADAAAAVVVDQAVVDRIAVLLKQSAKRAAAAAAAAASVRRAGREASTAAEAGVGASAIPGLRGGGGGLLPDGGVNGVNDDDDDGECPLQKRGLLTMESEAYYPSVALTRSTLSEYDVVTTTRLGSDVPILYPAWGSYDLYAPRSTAPGVYVDGARVMAYAAISNCAAQNGRLGVLAALLDAGVTVHNYGRCRQGPPRADGSTALSPAAAAATQAGRVPVASTGPDGSPLSWVAAKMAVLPRYKFVLAFENSAVPDYVTEKIYHAWAGGSLPVYMGAPNVAAFAPGGRGSYLDVADFPSVAALAAEMRRLDADDAAYAAYFAWKRAPVVPAFEELLARSSDVHVVCRLCIKVKELLDAELREGEAEREAPAEGGRKGLAEAEGGGGG